jgi:hypothetical protein
MRISNRNKIRLARCYINLVVISDDEKQEDVAVGCNYLQLKYRWNVVLYWADNVWTSLMRKEPVDVVKKH